MIYFLICYLTGSVLEVVSSAAFLEGPASLGLLVFLTDDDRHGMGTTLRISCYAAGAVALIVWIPLVDLLVVPHLAYVLIVGSRIDTAFRSHTLLPSLRLAGLFCVPVASSVILEYRAVQEVTQEPSLSHYYFPPPERFAELPRASRAR